MIGQRKLEQKYHGKGKEPEGKEHPVENHLLLEIRTDSEQQKGEQDQIKEEKRQGKGEAGKHQQGGGQG